MKQPSGKEELHEGRLFHNRYPAITHSSCGLAVAPPRAPITRSLLAHAPGEDIHENRTAAWYERWASLQRQFTFLPDVFKNTAAVVYDGQGQPVLVARQKASVVRSLAATKKAWLEESLERSVKSKVGIG